jgi:hypothetical protein
MEMDDELRSLIRESIENGPDFSVLDLLSEVTYELNASEVFYEVCDRLGIE